MASAPFSYYNYFQQQPWNPSTTAANPGGPYPFSAYTYGTDFSQDNPAFAMKQNRGMAGSWGIGMDAELNMQNQYAAQLQNYFMQPMTQMASRIADNPGFTPEEFAGITRGDQYAAGMTTPDEYASLDPTAGETAMMYGDPNSLYNSFAPNSNVAINEASAAAQRGVFGQAAGSLSDTLSRQRTGNQSTIGGARDQLTNSFLPSVAAAYRGHEGAIGDTLSGAGSRMSGMLGSAASNMGGTLGGAASSINASVNSPKMDLNLSPADYLMSDTEKQGLVNQAGQDVQQGARSRMDALRRQAAASGNSDPMALAALDFQSSRMADEGAANAMNSAQLAASAQQRGLAMDYARTKLGAGQTQAGMNVGAQESLAGLGIGSQEALLGQGIGSQQFLAGQGVSSQENLLAQQLNEANAYQGMYGNLTAEELQAIQNQTNAGMQAGEFTGSTGIGMESGIGSQAQNTAQFNTQMGTNIAGQVQNMNTQFGNQQYQNRLQNAMYGQQSRFNQNTAVNDRQAAAYQAAANARMGGQNNFLNWSSGQYGQAIGQQQTANQQRIGAAGTSLGAQNTATGNWGTYDLGARNTSFGSNFLASLGSTLGKTLGG